MSQSKFLHPVSATSELALNSGQVGTWHWDFAAERLQWSENMEQIHGMPSGSFDGSLDGFQASIHPQDRAYVSETIRAAIDAGADYNVEYRNLQHDGSVQWLEARGRVLHAKDGVAIGMAGICFDVTTRKRAERRLATQYAVTRLLAESDDLGDVASELLGTICRAVGWDVGELWRWDADQQVLGNEGQWCDDEIAAAGFDTVARGASFEPGHGLPGRVWVSGQALWIADLGDDREFLRKASAAAAGLRAGFAFPIRSGRRMIAVVVLLSRETREPDDDLLEMFEALGGQVGNFIERREAEITLRRRAEQQTVVAQLGQGALARPHIADLLAEVVSRVAETLDVEYAKILELRPNGTLLLCAGTGWQTGLVGKAVVPAGLDSQAGFTLGSPSPVIVANLAEEERFSGPDLLVQHGVVSGLSTVIHGRRQPFGVLGVHTKAKRAFTQDDASFLQAVANVVAMAVESGQAEETIRQLSTPILPLHEDMLILPVIGGIDEQRVEQLATQLLASIRAHRAKVVVIDTTGAAPLEPDIVHRLMKAGDAARLLGAKIIMTGISNEVGQALVQGGIDLTQITSLADLRSGVEEAHRLLAAAEAMPARRADQRPAR